MRGRAFTCCTAAIRNASRCCWREGGRSRNVFVYRRDEVMKMENPLEPVGDAPRWRLHGRCWLWSRKEKAQALRLMAAGVRSAAEKIVRENGLDMEEARKGGRNAAFTGPASPDAEERVEHIARGMEQVAALPDPVGECIREWTRPNGLVSARCAFPGGHRFAARAAAPLPAMPPPCA